jgi:hypothetical protein
VFLIACYTSVQIFKNSEAQKVFVSMVQTKLHKLVFRLGRFSSESELCLKGCIFANVGS